MPQLQPAWDTPARMDGLPCTNWKKRTGVTLSGTMADCIARWIALPSHQQQNCSIGWGPWEGQYGSMEAMGIAAYVRRHGLPPKALAARGGVQPSGDTLRRMTAMDRYEATPGPGKPAGDASHLFAGTAGSHPKIKKAPPA